MWVISAYLIEGAAPHKELTYFSAYEYFPGEVVKLPARGHTSWGLVTKCAALASMRQDVRAAGFALKKITGKGRAIYTKTFLHAAFELAAEEAVSGGAVLSGLTPTSILERLEALPEPAETEVQKGPVKPEWILESRDKRIQKYAALAERMQKESRSVLIVAPTIAEAERIATHVERSVLFHGELTKKKMAETWSAISLSKKPIVIVGTPSALSVPRTDLGAVLVERVLARGYERSSRPFVHIRGAAEELAKAAGARLFLGSPFLPVGDASGTQSSEFGTWSNAPNVERINMQRSQDPRSEIRDRPAFELCSGEAKEKIADMLARGENTLLVTARRGLAPHTTCEDCGTPLTCPRCSSGLVLHEEHSLSRISLVEGDARRWFQCHYCGFEEKVNVLCPVCGSWRLAMHGIGLTLAAREAAKLFPGAKLLVADDALSERASAAKKLAADFESSRGAILCATESMLAYLSQKIPLTVVVSVDSMLYVPEYTAPELTLAFLRELQGLSEEMLFQTRVPEHPALEAFVENDYSQYYRRELDLRKQFRYPPFHTLIRLSISGSPEREKRDADAIIKALEPFKPLRYGARTKRASIVREHILMRLLSDKWPDPKLLAFIRSLPPSVEIRINPRAIISD